MFKWSAETRLTLCGNSNFAALGHNPEIFLAGVQLSYIDASTGTGNLHIFGDCVGPFPGPVNAWFYRTRLASFKDGFTICLGLPLKLSLCSPGSLRLSGRHGLSVLSGDPLLFRHGRTHRRPGATRHCDTHHQKDGPPDDGPPLTVSPNILPGMPGSGVPRESPPGITRARALHLCIDLIQKGFISSQFVI